jgi:BlaI family penicillinase repressor
MEPLWTHGALSIREILETFRKPGRPAYTTVQTIVSRLEFKQAVRRVKKIGNACIFEAVTPRALAERRLVDELFGPFDGRSRQLIEHLIESGRLTLADIKHAESVLRGSTVGVRYRGAARQGRSNLRGPFRVE